MGTLPRGIMSNNGAMELRAKIYVAGHRGLVGSAVMRALVARGYMNLLVRTSEELDLRERGAVQAFFAAEKPEYVVLAAAKVGGILANDTYPATFIQDNLDIQNNVIMASYSAKVERLLFLGSSCIYPKECAQPIKEEYLLTGPLEPTNRAYAIAKIAGIEMCWSYNRQFGTKYLAAMPANLYGPGDNYDLHNSHVLPALVRKVKAAKAAMEKTVEVWGTGTPRREFLYSEDLAEACLFLMNLPEERFAALLRSEAPPLINVGYGSDVSIRELAETVARVLGWEGELVFDGTKPDGTMRKLLDSAKMRGLGWAPKVGLEEGIARVLGELKTQERKPG